MRLKVMDILGLAQRAGKVVSGDYRVKEVLKKNKAKLLVVAKDTSARALDDLTRLSKAHNVPLVKWGSKEDLGTAIGKNIRVSVAVLDEQFSDKILGVLERGEV